MKRVRWRAGFIGLALLDLCVAMGCTELSRSGLTLSAVPRSGSAPLSVRFEARTPHPALIAPFYQWDFGDGFTSTFDAPTHTYDTPGAYTVSLRVQTAHGTYETVREQFITVTATEGEGEGEAEVDPQPGEQRSFGGIPFVWIPPGTFIMGTDETAEAISDRYGDLEFFFRGEQPAHTVTISEGFWMGQYEVRQMDWLALMTENPSEFPGPNRPVERVSWDMCQSYIAALNERGEGTFRLPTEAEWEYVCRAGTTTEFSFGDSLSNLADHAWYFENSGFKTQPVGELLPNPLGIYDIHGNVYEWCADWYDEDYYAVSPETDPAGPETGRFRVRRGGFYQRVQSFCRSSFRTWNGPESQLSSSGFRLVRER
jgi:formylglycine-generating enzyme required for sulfatase activity